MEQVINIYPLVSFANQQTAGEGHIARVEVLLSGNAPNYPLVIPFSISGTADSLDYQISANRIVIESGDSGFVDITIKEDFQQEENEELILTFKSSVNTGNHSIHTIIISEENIAPKAKIGLVQANEKVASITQNKGEATVTLEIDDGNVDDQHIISWDIPQLVNAQISANQLNVSIDPKNINLADENKGLLTLSVTITDTGVGDLSHTAVINIPVLEQYGTLDQSDTDLDGIADNIEGFSDNDGDGIPAYLDNSTIPYLQQLHVNASATKLIETEPGLKISLGKYAKQQFSDGVQLSANEIANTGLITTDTLTHLSDYFDFEVSQILPYGRAIFIVIPLVDTLPEFGIYRKFTKADGWQDFVEDANNSLWSSKLIDGVCPRADSDSYLTGLIQGNTCLRLLIEDGGPNDADGIANGTVDDPGVIGIIPNSVIAEKTDPETSSSGGSFSWLALLFGLFIFLNRGKGLLKTN